MEKIKLDVIVENDDFTDDHLDDEYHNTYPAMKGCIFVPFEKKAIEEAAYKEGLRLMEREYKEWDIDSDEKTYVGFVTVRFPSDISLEILADCIGSFTISEVVKMLPNKSHPIKVEYRHKPKIYFALAIADSMFPPTCTIHRWDVSVESIRKLINRGLIISAVNPGHQATLKALESRYNIKIGIPETPPKISLNLGDSVIVASVRGLPRLMDRHEYTDEEISSATFEFGRYRIFRI